LLAALSFHVMPRAQVRATPGVLGALAGVVHSRQGARDYYEHQRRHNEGYGGFHLCGLALFSTYPNPAREANQFPMNAQ
jgi:hypothetical protein